MSIFSSAKRTPAYHAGTDLAAARTHLILHGWVPAKALSNHAPGEYLHVIHDGHMRVVHFANGSVMEFFDRINANEDNGYKPCEWYDIPSDVFWRLHDFAIDQRYVPLGPVPLPKGYKPVPETGR